MRIDPIIVLAEELRAAELSLRTATCERRQDEVRNLLLEIGLLENCLAETEPTSVVGAGELLRLAAEYIQHRHARLATRIRAVARRMREGERSLPDVVWLRTAARELAGGSCGEQGLKAAQLLQSAISGAARPVLVFRAP